MNINQAMSETKILMAAGQAVMWSSGSGLGKSQSAVKMAQDWIEEGKTNGIKRGMGIIFLATQTPPDLIGYQFKGDRDIIVGVDADGKPETKRITVSDASCPLWFISTEGKPAFCYDQFWLIIDEYGQGEGDVKRSAAEILLNGGTPPWYLPPGSIRLALTNEGARYGVSKDFDFAIARRTKLEIKGDIEASLVHMDKPYVHQGKQWSVMGVTKAWAAANPTVLFENEPEKQGPWCNPRQLYAVDRYMQLKMAATGVQEVDSQSMEVLAGTIGMPATTSLASHLSFRLQLPSYDTVVADPQGTEVPSRADLQMLMAYELSSYAKPADLGPVITYMQRLPKDMAVTFVSSLLRRDYKQMINVPAMQAWINKNAALVSVISSLAH
jgi:hypothetical protein